MTIVKLPNETLGSGKGVATYYSTKPFNLEEFVQEVQWLKWGNNDTTSILGKI